MTEALSFLTPALMATIPVVVALVQVIKQMGLSDRYAPIASIVLGIGLAAVVTTGLVPIIIGGIVVGLSASGLYSGALAVKNG